jgi:hypothetical protein
MRKLTGILIAGAMLIACNNEKKDSSNTSTETKKEGTSPKSNGQNVISFSVDGKQVTSSGWTISRFDFGTGAGTSVNVTSNMHEEPRTINININGDTPGSYTIGSGVAAMKNHGMAYGSYYADYLKDMSSPYSFTEGEFVIVSIDTTAGLLNANFHGTATNAKGESIKITDGKVIDGKLKAGVTKLN